MFLDPFLCPALNLCLGPHFLKKHTKNISCGNSHQIVKKVYLRTTEGLRKRNTQGNLAGEGLKNVLRKRSAGYLKVGLCQPKE